MSSLAKIAEEGIKHASVVGEGVVGHSAAGADARLFGYAFADHLANMPRARHVAAALGGLQAERRISEQSGGKALWLRAGTSLLLLACATWPAIAESLGMPSVLVDRLGVGQFGVLLASELLTRSWSSLPFGVLPLLRQFWQRRNLYLQRITGLWDEYQRWEDAATSSLERLAMAKLLRRTPSTLRMQRSTGGMHSLQSFHKARGIEFLLTPDVATCRLPEDVREHAQRILRERWCLADEPCKDLQPILE